MTISNYISYFLRNYMYLTTATIVSLFVFSISTYLIVIGERLGGMGLISTIIAWWAKSPIMTYNIPTDEKNMENTDKINKLSFIKSNSTNLDSYSINMSNTDRYKDLYYIMPAQYISENKDIVQDDTPENVLTENIPNNQPLLINTISPLIDNPPRRNSEIMKQIATRKSSLSTQ